jgi:serine/threonine-protein kinase
MNPPSGNEQPLNWDPFFAEAGIDGFQWDPTEPDFRPDSYVDYRATWKGSLPNKPGVSVHIEATALQGKPASFEITGPWTGADQAGSVRTRKQQISDVSTALLIVIAVIAGIFFARRNLKLGRGDRRNATRLAVLVMILDALAYIMTTRQSPASDLLKITWMGGIVWVLYIAIEPSVRRKWPRMLIGWTRLVSGEWRDPLVARDTLIGCATSVLFTGFYMFFYFIVLPRLGHAGPEPMDIPLIPLTGISSFLSSILEGIVWSIYIYLILITFMRMLTTFLKNQRITAIMFVLVLGWLIGSSVSWSYGVNFILAAMLVFMLMRFGFLAVVVGYFCGGVLFGGCPITLDASIWYARYGFGAIVIFMAIVIYAFYHSLGGRPIFGTPRLDD